MQGGDTPAVIAAGLPNITGTMPFDFENVTGAFVIEKQIVNGSGAGSGRDMLLHLDASKSNPIYGRSDTVQPPAICLIPQLRY